MALKINSQRINLRTLRKSDAFSIYENAKDRDISRYTTLPSPYKLKHAEEFVRQTHQNLRKKSAYELGIEDPQTEGIIGMISLMKINYESKNAEVGFWLGKKYWGQGLTKEALHLILNFGFRKLKLRRIYARVMHPNVTSAKLLEKVGFKLEGRMRKSFFRNGRYYDELRYGLLREEYRSLDDVVLG